MAKIKTEEEIDLMRKGGLILNQVLKQVGSNVRPGVTTKELDLLAKELIVKKGGQPSFLNYSGFPGNICVSINDEIVHGIGDFQKIKNGDLVSLDIGVTYKGLITDSAITVGCGKISDFKQKMIEVCRECLKRGIAKCKTGNRIGDIGFAIQQQAQKNGFSVVRELVGHGVGHKVHEEPAIPNYGRKGQGEKLKEGMCVALEPMIVQGSPAVVLDKDGWTYKTKDRGLACHFEHTVVVRKKRGEILT